MSENMGATSPPLNVVALISGGKDSFYSLLHCIANKHQVIALANVHPAQVASPPDNTEDLNSYMYQTAGHAIIPLYAEALGIPLYRQEVSGEAASTLKTYHFESSVRNAQDETESLLPLLKKVIAAHPTVNAVCSGAILSTYQRTRIESVARRLNLIPLSYLWHYPTIQPSSPGALLDDMAAIGFDVRIVKVASGGLDEELLWSNLMDSVVRRKVERSMTRFGGSILGEGGEYETLVVDGPSGLWRGRIEVQNHKMLIGRGGGGEAWIVFEHGAGMVRKRMSSNDTYNEDWRKLIRPIELWDKQFKTLVARTISFQQGNKIPNDGEQPSIVQQINKPKMVVIPSGSQLVVANITALEAESSARDQMMGITSKILNVLKDYAPCTTDDIIFTTVLLRSMTDFGVINSIYGQLFLLPNPPARVTIACGDALPEGVNLMMSIVLDLGPPTARDGLHVQSRSYWAPSNIGPYSQAISVPQNDEKGTSLIYIAGQIPLVPASMEVHEPEIPNSERNAAFLSSRTFFESSCLALQHLWRIGRAMRVGWWTGAVAFITGESDMQMRAELAWEVWKGIHQRGLWEEDEELDVDIDVWDRVHGTMGNFVKEGAGNPPLPDFARFSHLAPFGIPGFLAAEVDELPRGCAIEWQSLGVALSNSVTSTGDNPVSFIYIDPEQELRSKLIELLESIKHLQKVDVTVYTTNMALVMYLDVQIIPVRRVWGSSGLQLAGAIIVKHHPE